MKMSNNLSDKIKLYCKTSNNLLEMFKNDFNEQEYLELIWEWAPWIKTMKDCRLYHSHIMFRVIQEKIMRENPQYEIAKEEIYAYLEKVYQESYSDLDLETGRFINKSSPKPLD